MPRLGEKFSFELTWQQELGIDPVVPSTHDWFVGELDGLVQAILNKNKEAEDYYRKRIMSQIDQLEKERVFLFELNKRMAESLAKLDVAVRELQMVFTDSVEGNNG